MKKYLIIFVLLFAFPFSAYSWWDEGHMVVAQIAYEKLDPKTKLKVDELSKTFGQFYPEIQDFITISCWADKVKSNHRLTIFDEWHYTNIPYDIEHILSGQKLEKIKENINHKDAIWAINQAKTTLSNPKSNAFEKALMLHLAVHIIGDIHQPLHTTSLYNHAHPEGNLGGNLFAIKEMCVSNLHLLWDSVFGTLASLNCPPNDAERNTLKELAVQLMNTYPSESFSDCYSLNPMAWALESHKLAIDVAYQLEENSTPTEQYLQQSKDVALKQLALAGYRLAAFLNQTFSEDERP